MTCFRKSIFFFKLFHYFYPNVGHFFYFIEGRGLAEILYRFMKISAS